MSRNHKCEEIKKYLKPDGGLKIRDRRMIILTEGYVDGNIGPYTINYCPFCAEELKEGSKRWNL